MDRIPCQDPRCSTGSGCWTCGGYRAVLERAECPNCRSPYWVRPGVYTSYHGKRWRSFDGVELIDLETGRVCSRCYKVDRE